MKAKSFVIQMLCLMQTLGIYAQKSVYIPNDWKNFNAKDTLLYAESDPDNKYTWSKSRSKESDNVVVFWDKYYGSTSPSKAATTYRVDIDDLLTKCESFFKLETETLGFASKNLEKYKIMVLINHSTEWICVGSGYDYQVSALWLAPSACKPVGSAVAHEVGHSIHYMCYGDDSNYGKTSGVQTGFHSAVGNGATIWETTANWQSLQSYPDEYFTMSYIHLIFPKTHNYAFTHEWQRYQAFPFLQYLCEYYNDRTTVAQVWKQHETTVKDFNQVLMDLKGLSVRELYKLHFDFAMHAVTWDFDFVKDMDKSAYIGKYNFNYVNVTNKKYQVALSSVPQSTGFNVIPLQVPAAGTQINTQFTALHPGAYLAEGDPAQIVDGTSEYVSSGLQKYNSVGTNTSKRAFRLGYVALMKDGTTQYFSEDSLYCQTSKEVTEEFGYTVPENVSRLWLVVSPCPTSYIQHKWDDAIAGDDMWPYAVEFANTNILGAPTIDDNLSISDVTLTYDVYFPKSSSDYSGTTVTVADEAASALGTAFQMQAGSINNNMIAWASAGPSDGQMMFYAANASGSINNAGSTANGYGHWFTAAGVRCAYGSGYLYSEFTPSSLTFNIGQYPGRLTNGKDYTIRQAIKYKKGDKTALATFVFNVHVQTSKTGYELTDVEQAEVVTDVNSVAAPTIENNNIYTLDGRLIKDTNSLEHGVYIKNGKKYIK